MKSPFPGMDPYLEAHWLDLHPRLIIGSSRLIQRQLGEDLVARVEQRVVVEDTFGYARRRIGPDVRVVEINAGAQPATSGGTAVATAPASGRVHLTELTEPVKQRFLEIIDVKAGGRVITVIEFVSPSNKSSRDGAKQYRDKQDDCFGARVNLVEIDLTRGDRTLLCHRWADARLHESTYQISVWRASSPSAVDLYPVSLRQRLPEIHIPLRPGDQDATLELQAVLDECYADARYDRTTDYNNPPELPLDEADAAWARGLIDAAQKK